MYSVHLMYLCLTVFVSCRSPRNNVHRHQLVRYGSTTYVRFCAHGPLGKEALPHRKLWAWRRVLSSYNGYTIRHIPLARIAHNSWLRMRWKKSWDAQARAEWPHSQSSNHAPFLDRSGRWTRRVENINNIPRTCMYFIHHHVFYHGGQR